MRNIKLADLFACDELGTMRVAEDRETGQPIHIVAADRGLKCDCLCPVCRRPVVARKGSRQHSFAHYPEDVQRSCAVAGESLLHRFAKDVLARAKFIMRPALTARDELGVLELKPSGKVVFDRVELEAHQGDVVPDVACYVGDRRLFVEFRVTHAVDDAKLRKLRAHDASVMEIDLSAFRECELTELPLAILVEAPRVMLQSGILARAPELLARRKEERLAALRVQSTPYLEAFNKQEHVLDTSSEPWFLEAARHSVSDLVEEKPFVDEPFRVKPEQWKTWVLWQLLTTETGWTARHLAYLMLKAKWIKQGLYNPPETVCKFIRSDGHPGFRSATEAVQEFLEVLKSQDRAYATGGRRFFANGVLRRWYQERCDELTIPDERREDLKGIVDSIVRVLPMKDRRDFSFDEWLETRAAENKLTVEELLSPSSGYYDDLWDGLNKVRKTMAAAEPDADFDMMGLPVGGYFLDKQEKFEARRRLAEEQDRLDALRRADKLEAFVRSFQSPNPEKWLLRPTEYDGRLAIPGEHASRSPQAAADMRRLFLEEQKRREEETRFARIKAESQAALLSHAMRVYGSAERASVWMSCHLKEIGMRRPIDFCVDEATLAECLSALPALKRR